MHQIKIRSIFLRILATFTATALGFIGLGSLVGASPWVSAAIAGGASVARVLESLSRAYLRDGKLTEYEINMAFSSNVEGTLADKKRKSVKPAETI